MSDKYSGTIGVSDVIGKAAMIVWPVNRFGFLGSPDPQQADAAGAVVPYAFGLAGAFPVVVLRRRRRHQETDRDIPELLL
jgi:signal peptidase I